MGIMCRLVCVFLNEFSWDLLMSLCVCLSVVPMSLGVSVSVCICVPVWTPIFVAVTLGTLRTYTHFCDCDVNVQVGLFMTVSMWALWSGMPH